MGILVDVIVILILVLNILLGYKKGLINVIFSICAFLIAIIITLFFFKPLSNIIVNNTEFDNKIKEVIIKNNLNKNEEEVEENKEKNTNIIKNYIDLKVKQKADEVKTKAVETIATTISVRIVDVITGIVLFVAIRIILIVLKFLFEAIAEFPIIKQFNEIGGILYGVLKGLVIIYLLLTTIFIATSIKGSNIIHENIEKSHVTKILYDNNIVVNYCLLDKNLL